MTTTDFQLEQLFDAAHEHGQFGREFREHARSILATPPLPVQPYINTPDAVIEAAYQRLDLSSVPHALRPSIAFEAGWRAALASSPAVQAVPAEAIGRLLEEAMNRAVRNGANSVSMPDYLVEIAGWLASAPQAPAPEPIQTQDSGHPAERLIPDAHRDGEASS